MRIGTRSLLVGAHAFWLHPWFVAWGWWRLYGQNTTIYPSRTHGQPMAASIWSWRLWLAFFVHDVGYFGKPNMDGREGEDHPFLGAELMLHVTKSWAWFDFTLYHSRYLANQIGDEPSPLCWADKMAIVLTPWWLYVPLTRLTGEIREYQTKPGHVKETGHDSSDTSWKSDIEWYRMVQRHMAQTVVPGRDRDARV